MGLADRTRKMTEAGLADVIAAWEAERRATPTKAGKPITASGLDHAADRAFSDAKIAQMLAVRALDRQKRWGQVAKLVPAGKRSKQSETYEWVASHLRCEPEDCDPEGVPSVAAVNRLLTALGTDASLDAFWREYQRVTAEKSEKGELLKRFEDDGRSLDEFFEKVDRIYAEEERKVLGGAAV